MRRLEEQGYKLTLQLEANILLTRPEDEQMTKTSKKSKSLTSGSGSQTGTLKLNASDRKYLKSLQISLNSKVKKR